MTDSIETMTDLRTEHLVGVAGHRLDVDPSTSDHEVDVDTPLCQGNCRNPLAVLTRQPVPEVVEHGVPVADEDVLAAAKRDRAAVDRADAR